LVEISVLLYFSTKGKIKQKIIYAKYNVVATWL